MWFPSAKAIPNGIRFMPLNENVVSELAKYRHDVSDNKAFLFFYGEYMKVLVNDYMRCQEALRRIEHATKLFERVAVASNNTALSLNPSWSVRVLRLHIEFICELKCRLARVAIVRPAQFTPKADEPIMVCHADVFDKAIHVTELFGGALGRYTYGIDSLGRFICRLKILTNKFNMSTFADHYGLRLDNDFPDVLFPAGGMHSGEYVWENLDHLAKGVRISTRNALALCGCAKSVFSTYALVLEDMFTTEDGTNALEKYK